MRAAGDADVREVVVDWPAFPQPAGEGDGGKRIRARIAPDERLALPGRSDPDPVAELVQVTHVVTPGGVDLTFAVGLLVARLAE